MKIIHLLSGFIFLSAFYACDKIKLNKVPVADAGLPQTIQLPVDSVTLTGSGKDDYKWLFVEQGLRAEYSFNFYARPIID